MDIAANSPFDFTSAQREALGRAVLDWVLNWSQYPSARPLYPAVKAANLQRALSEDLPVDGQDPAAVLDDFSRHVAGGARDNGHPRMFGYVQSSGRLTFHVVSARCS